MKQSILVPLILVFIVVALLWYYLSDTATPVPVGPPPAPSGLPMNAGLSMGHVSYNPADYLYGWENYPRGPAWAFGDRRPWLEEERALGGHFGGGVFSPRDPLLEAELGGVHIGRNLYNVGGMGGDGHW
jgi:hypothetical protein